MKTSEKYLERKLTNTLHTMGVWCEKYTNPFKSGYPDRLCILPGGKVFWVELKTTGQKLRKLQQVRRDELNSFGTPVFEVDDESSLRDVLDLARKTIDLEASPDAQKCP